MQDLVRRNCGKKYRVVFCLWMILIICFVFSLAFYFIFFKVVLTGRIDKPLEGDMMKEERKDEEKKRQKRRR